MWIDVSKVTKDSTTCVHCFYAASGTYPDNENVSYISFDSKGIDSLNFVQSLDIPAIKIEQWQNIANLIREVSIEYSL